jgi:hypothetical protein
MWTKEEQLFWLLLALIIGAALGAIGAWICDWLEEKYPYDSTFNSRRWK